MSRQSKKPGRPKTVDVTPPVRPDFEALAKRQPVEGRDTSIFGPDIEISAALLDQIIAHVKYLERSVDAGRLKPPPLTELRREVVDCECRVWLAHPAFERSGKIKFPTWNQLQPFLDSKLYEDEQGEDQLESFERKLRNWHKQRNYMEEYGRRCIDLIIGKLKVSRERGGTHHPDVELARLRERLLDLQGVTRSALAPTQSDGNKTP